MLPKKYRLNRRQINLIYKKGQSKKFGHIGVKFLTNNLTFPRFAVVVPLSAAKKAVARHRLRRIIFDELQKLLENKNIQNKDYIMRVFQTPIDEKILRPIVRGIFQNV